MQIWEAILLGVVQGLTEFWPISSSAHLAILPQLLHWDSALLNSRAFDVALHAGTLLAVVLYFWDDILDLTLCWFKPQDNVVRRENRRLGRRILLATLPAVLAALFLDHYFENAFRSLGSIAVALIAGGVLMGVLDLLMSRRDDLSRMRNTHALIIGCCQAVALIPGVSRSGASLTALRALGFKRSDAARFTFLISLPIIAGAVLYEGRKIAGDFAGGEWPVLLAGVVSSFAVGWLTIHAFMRLLRSHSLTVFAVYRVLLGAGILVWVYFSGV